MANVLGISLAVVMVFTFYISGAGIRGLLNLKNLNPFSSIIFGFFMYFAFLTTISLPFQFSNILIKSYIYVIFGFSIVYLIVALIFIRLWVTTEIFSMKLVQFITAALILFGVIYGIQEAVVPSSNQLEHQYTILMHRMVQIRFSAHLGDVLDPHQKSIFYVFEYMIMTVFDGQITHSEHFIKYFWLITNAIICASLFIEIFTQFAERREQWRRWILFGGVLILFCGLLTALAYLDLSIYTSEAYFTLLIIYTILLVIKNASSRFLQNNEAFVIGFVLGSYMAFSIENTYPVLFLIYTFIFVIQLRVKVGYFRDVFRMSWLILLEFLIYNIISSLWVQTVVICAIFLILLSVSIRTRGKYYLGTKFELYLQQRNIVAILLIPIIFFAISFAYSLAKGTSFYPKDVEYLQIILYWFDDVSNLTAKSWTIFLSTLIVLGISVAWVFIRQRVKKNLVAAAADVFFILYLTFYNPFVTSTIQAIEPGLNQASGYSLIASAFVLFILIPFEIDNKLIKKTESKLKIYTHPMRTLI